MNPLLELKQAGQSVWLDLLRRSLITSGGLERLIEEDGLGGVTSNPTIFSKAIGGSTDYDAAISRTVEKGGRRGPVEIFYDLALEDIQMAADVFRPGWANASGADGFVSFELEPKLAYDTAGSVAKAKELFAHLGKPNVMIKVPGTPEGVPAVEELTAAGVNVNITLLFSVQMYEGVAWAYVRGLERRLDRGAPLEPVASVASFFVSRVDTAVDARLAEGSTLRGKVAVANAKLAYERFSQIFSGERWRRLAAAGARVQRPLWASTGTKDPAYSDVLYVEELVAPDTVNTMPTQTMDTFRDHGKVRPDAASEGLDQAHAVLEQLAAEGVDLDEVNAGLIKVGIDAFDRDLTKLLETIERKVSEVHRGRTRWSAALGDLDAAIELRTHVLHDQQVVSRVWRKDHTLWKPGPDEISDRLGWLHVTDLIRERAGELEQFAAEVAEDGFDRVVLLGMGGSSLAPHVLREVAGAAPGFPDLSALDTTHPSAVSRLEDEVDPDKTLFIVASKSGGTVETLSHFAYFFEKAPRGAQFVAITDPGSGLESLGRQSGFRRVFLNPEDIGGRYSALSYFGLVPAALLGVDLDGLVDQAEEMAHACREWMHPGENPGAWLGAVIGQAALGGRDKLTLVLPERYQDFGDWAEQLVAESTGKEGAGIVPVVGEALGAPGSYGSDRLFVSLGQAPDGLADIEAAGQPVIRLDEELGGGDGRARRPVAWLGREFFRFEFAVAVAGHILGINPFDQPNVAEAKEATAQILKSGAFDGGGIDEIGPLLDSVGPGDYVAVQAFLDPTPENQAALQTVRLALRDRFRVATTVGFGPRFLHSTGQLHKGGPDTGVFIQVVDEGRSHDVAVPGKAFTFGELMDAQALGDLKSLRAKGRRIARTTLDSLRTPP